MKILSQNGLTELISKIKTWGNSTFLNKTEVEQTTVLSIDSTPTANSNNLVTSGGVEDFVNNKIVQTTGQSTTAVMSQKAVTDEINALKSDITDLQTALIGVSELIGGAV